MFDRLSWREAPEFFVALDDIKNEFELKYCIGYTSWDDLDNDQLDYWCGRIDNEFNEFPLISFDNYELEDEE